MVVAKKKPAPVEKEQEKEKENTAIAELPFGVKLFELGRQIRNLAPETLKFDSNVDNINYDYVDTQQYKALLGACCDAVGLTFSWSVKGEPDFSITQNEKGKQIFVASLCFEAIFRDAYDFNSVVSYSAIGLGVSFGNTYAFSIAQTNALRNFITNCFLLPTSDREGDDVKQIVSSTNFLTESQKAEKKEELLSKTKSNAEYATIMFANVAYKRIQETLEKNIPDDFRKTLEKFLETKFKDGKPVTNDDNKTWIVKKKAANAIMNDLDAYND